MYFNESDLPEQVLTPLNDALKKIEGSFDDLPEATKSKVGETMMCLAFAADIHGGGLDLSGHSTQACLISVSNGEGTHVLKTALPWPQVICLLGAVSVINRQLDQKLIATVEALLVTDNTPIGVHFGMTADANYTTRGAAREANDRLIAFADLLKDNAVRAVIDLAASLDAKAA